MFLVVCYLMEIILDTSFILTCIKEKIDFLDAERFGKLLIPKHVIDELENLKEKKKGRERERAELALAILKKSGLKEIDLEKNFVDAGIIKYVQDKKDIAVATLDRELKKKIKGKTRFLVIKDRKKLEID